MPLNPYLASTLDSASSFAERADAVNLAINAKNAAAQVQNVQAYVVMTDELEELFREAIKACRDLACVGTIDAMAEAKAEVVAAVDRLRSPLDRAEPNERAKAIGMDWWPDR